MSLKQRLVASLVAVLLMALLLVGWVGYRQAANAVTRSLSEQLQSLTETTAQEASSEHRRIRAGLADLAQSPEIEDLISGDGEANSTSRRGLADARIRENPLARELLESGGTVELRSREGALILSVTGAATGGGSDSRACPRSFDAIQLQLAVSVNDGGENPVGSLSFRGPGDVLLTRSDATHLVGTRGWSALVDSERGKPVHLIGCADPAVLGRLLERGVGPSRSRWRSTKSPSGDGPWEDGSNLVEDHDVEGTGLRIIAAASPAEFFTPLHEAGRSYGIFVLLVAVGAAVLGLLIVNAELNSLEEVAVATARIGADENVPWLPPPGNDEVGRLSLALNQLADRVDQRMQSAEHVGSMTAIRELTSHLVRDIKNPLSSLRLSLQSIQREVGDGGIPERWRGTIATSLNELKRVDRVISYILKAGAQRKVIIAPCSVRDAIHDCADLLSEEFERKNIRFRAYLHEGPDRVLADPGRLKNSILQLLQNSVEVLEPGGLLEMRTETTEWRGGAAVVVAIRDDGPGIDPEDRGRIFDPFFSTKPEAAGIGLAVARRNIQEFGGDLRLVPLPAYEEGAEFSLVLPLTGAKIRAGEVIESEDSAGHAG